MAIKYLHSDPHLTCSADGIFPHNTHVVVTSSMLSTSAMQANPDHTLKNAILILLFIVIFFLFAFPSKALL